MGRIKKVKKAGVQDYECAAATGAEQHQQTAYKGWGEHRGPKQNENKQNNDDGEDELVKMKSC